MNQADFAIDFVQNLTLTGDYSGKPVVLREWQKDILRKIYTPYNAEGRLPRHVFCFLPRGSAKSEMAAWLIVIHLLGNCNHGKEVYSCGRNEKQAGIIFRKVSQVLRQDPALESLVEISDFLKQVKVKTCPQCGQRDHSFYTAATTDTSGLATQGWNPSLVLFDELEAMGKNRAYYQAVKKSMGKRLQNQMCVLSTAGSVGTLVEDEFRYAQKIEQGVIEDPSYIPILYYLEKNAPCRCGQKDCKGDWHCRANWHKASPALGDFLDMEVYESEYKLACEIPHEKLDFECFRLNRFVDITEALIPMEHWLQCNGEPDINPGDPVWVACDLGATDDWTAASILTVKENRLHVKTHYWLPVENAERGKIEWKIPLMSWVEDERVNVRLTPGNATDFDQVRADLNEILKPYAVKQVALDPHKASQLGQQLQQDGFAVEFFSQAKAMYAPTSELVRRVLAHQLNTGGDPVLTWMASNTIAIRNQSGDLRPDRSDRNNKIDGIVSLIMSIGLAGLGQHIESPYKRRGVITV